MSDGGLLVEDGPITEGVALSSFAAKKYVVTTDKHGGTLIHAAVGAKIVLAEAAAPFDVNTPSWHPSSSIESSHRDNFLLTAPRLL